MKHLDIASILDAVPIKPKAPPKPTRAQKLMHWAHLVNKQRRHLALFHNLEYWDRTQLVRKVKEISGPYSNAFTVAINDPALQQAGLKTDASIKDIMDFFELSQAELHEFSCDCGGDISNSMMAGRLAHLASQSR
jgi:hypothetical protein